MNKKRNNNMHTELLEEKPEFYLNENIPPKSHKIENCNTIVQHNYSNMHASLSNFNLFLKTLPLNGKTLSGKSIPLTYNGKNCNESIPTHIFT